MKLSATLEECIERVSCTLQTQFEGKIDACLLENIIIGVNQQLIRAHQLGFKDGLAAKTEKEK